MPSTKPLPYEIYAAFDQRSMRVFQRAMSLSHGGIVRVDDLLQALNELERNAASDVISASWRFATACEHGDPGHLTPMANEPALRQVLETAFGLNAPAAITPETLWRSAIQLRNWTGHTITATIPRPDSPIRTQISIPVATATKFSATAPHTDAAFEILLEECIQLWLKSVESPDSATDSTMAAIVRLVRQVESSK